jgi:hypothetical protein
MPMGIENPAVGYVSVCAIKFVGYSLAGYVISKQYQKEKLNSLLVGGIRTLIGMGFGAAYFCFFSSLPTPTLDQIGGWGYLAGLIPIRIVEWWLLLWIFYDRKFERRRRDWAIVVLGTIWSYILDIPAIASFILTAGVYVC